MEQPFQISPADGAQETLSKITLNYFREFFNIFSYLLYISLSNFKCGPSTNISSHNLGADNACRFFKTDCKSYEKCVPRRLSGHIWPGVYRCVCSKKGWHVVRGRGCMGKLEYLHCLFFSKQLLYISLN